MENIIIEWINDKYQIIAVLVVPIIVAILKIFKLPPFKIKKASIKGNNNFQIQTDRDVKNTHSFNTTTVTVPNSNLNLVQGNQTNIYVIPELIIESFINTMYPHTQVALNQLRSNSFEFLKIFENEFRKFSKEELQKFSEPEVLIVLQDAIKAAAKKDSLEIHQTLAQLIADRVQQPKGNVADLAIDESIRVTSKLDVNLIKILSLNFIFARTKSKNVLTEDVLFNRLSIIANSFKEIDITISKFEYLEAISCGKVLQIISNNNLITILAKSYPQLFIKKIPKKYIEELNLPQQTKLLYFSRIDEEHYSLDPVIKLYLYENINDTIPIALDDYMINELKKVCAANRLSEKEIETFLIKEVIGFNLIIDFWKNKNLGLFNLNSVGICISRAYLEQAGFGDFDINIWIN